MTKLTIGTILRQMMTEANLSPAHVADRLGKARQNVYLDFKRTSMRDEHIAEYANIFGVDKKVIYDRMNGEAQASGDSNYLMDHLAKLEEKFIAMAEHSKALADQLRSQLETKDRQIEKLLDLLGKLNPAPVLANESRQKRNLRIAA